MVWSSYKSLYVFTTLSITYIHTHANAENLISTYILMCVRFMHTIRYSSFLTSCSQALNCKWMPVFLMHSFKTCMFNHSAHVFRVKFVFDRHRFTRMYSSSNSCGTNCEYVASSDSSLHVQTSLSCALLEQ